MGLVNLWHTNFLYCVTLRYIVFIGDWRCEFATYSLQADRTTDVQLYEPFEVNTKNHGIRTFTSCKKIILEFWI